MVASWHPTGENLGGGGSVWDVVMQPSPGSHKGAGQDHTHDQGPPWRWIAATRRTWGQVPTGPGSHRARFPQGQVPTGAGSHRGRFPRCPTARGQVTTGPGSRRARFPQGQVPAGEQDRTVHATRTPVAMGGSDTSLKQEGWGWEALWAEHGWSWTPGISYVVLWSAFARWPKLGRVWWSGRVGVRTAVR